MFGVGGLGLGWGGLVLLLVDLGWVLCCLVLMLGFRLVWLVGGFAWVLGFVVWLGWVVLDDGVGLGGWCVFVGVGRFEFGVKWKLFVAGFVVLFGCCWVGWV